MLRCDDLRLQPHEGKYTSQEHDHGRPKLRGKASELGSMSFSDGARLQSERDASYLFSPMHKPVLVALPPGHGSPQNFPGSSHSPQYEEGFPTARSIDLPMSLSPMRAALETKTPVRQHYSWLPTLDGSASKTIQHQAERDFDRLLDSALEDAPSFLHQTHQRHCPGDLQLEACDDATNMQDCSFKNQPSLSPQSCRGFSLASIIVSQSELF